ncbi:MAG TPA: hypothetical protein VEJ67_03285 [Candidatus Cybelea sp.]|nr:hypothetical protein [Candidatus Cybelea sp.]
MNRRLWILLVVLLLAASVTSLALAKVLESTDRALFSHGHVVSGHTLKHVAASISAYWILRMLECRRPLLPLGPMVAR